MSEPLVVHAQLDGEWHRLAWDGKCLMCGGDVPAPSMNGPAICAWCDCGRKRTGEKWTLDDCMKYGQNLRRAVARQSVEVVGRVR